MKILDFNRNVLEEDRVIENGFFFFFGVQIIPTIILKNRSIILYLKNCILMNERARLILLIPQYTNFFSLALNIFLQYYFHLILY